MKKYAEKIIIWTCWAYLFFIDICILGCSTQKEIVTDTTSSMERQDSVIVTKSQTDQVEHRQQWEWTSADSLHFSFIHTVFLQERDSATGEQLLLSRTEGTLTRIGNETAQGADSLHMVKEDTIHIDAGKKMAGKTKKKEKTKKEVKALPDWERIILGIVIFGMLALVAYLVYTAPPLVDDPDDPDQGWLS